MKRQHAHVAIAILLITLAVILRLLPHPANFAPVAAIAIFGGAVLPRKLALWVPLATMMISDAIIGFYPMMPVIWACYFLIALASSTWLKRPNMVHVGILTISSSLFFFVVTNFAVWVSSGMYAHTLHGLAMCYMLAMPFFRNTFVSDVLYTTAMFSLYALAGLVVGHHFRNVQKSKTVIG